MLGAKFEESSSLRHQLDSGQGSGLRVRVSVTTLLKIP